MDHSLRTADRHYAIAGGLRVSARVAALIATLCHTDVMRDSETEEDKEEAIEVEAVAEETDEAPSQKSKGKSSTHPGIVQKNVMTAHGSSASH